MSAKSTSQLPTAAAGGGSVDDCVENINVSSELDSNETINQLQPTSNPLSNFKNNKIAFNNNSLMRRLFIGNKSNATSDSYSDLKNENSNLKKKVQTYEFDLDVLNKKCIKYKEERDAILLDLEQLTQSLFEEANLMVSTERKKSHELNQEKEHLKKTISILKNAVETVFLIKKHDTSKDGAEKKKGGNERGTIERRLTVLTEKVVKEAKLVHVELFEKRRKSCGDALLFKKNEKYEEEEDLDNFKVEILKIEEKKNILQSNNSNL